MISDFLPIRKFHTLSFFVKEVCSVYFTEENFKLPAYKNGHLTSNL